MNREATLASLPKLRRCPCCGSEAIWHRQVTEHFKYAITTRSDLWRVVCNNCNVRTAWSDSQVFIASEWNRVPPPDKHQPNPAEQSSPGAAA